MLEKDNAKITKIKDVVTAYTKLCTACIQAINTSDAIVVKLTIKDLKEQSDINPEVNYTPFFINGEGWIKMINHVIKNTNTRDAKITAREMFETYISVVEADLEKYIMADCDPEIGITFYNADNDVITTDLEKEIEAITNEPIGEQIDAMYNEHVKNEKAPTENEEQEQPKTESTKESTSYESTFLKNVGIGFAICAGAVAIGFAVVKLIAAIKDASEGDIVILDE